MLLYLPTLLTGLQLSRRRQVGRPQPGGDLTQIRAQTLSQTQTQALTQTLKITKPAPNPNAIPNQVEITELVGDDELLGRELLQKLQARSLDITPRSY